MGKGLMESVSSTAGSGLPLQYPCSSSVGGATNWILMFLAETVDTRRMSTRTFTVEERIRRHSPCTKI